MKRIDELTQRVLQDAWVARKEKSRGVPLDGALTGPREVTEHAARHRGGTGERADRGGPVESTLRQKEAKART